MKIKILPSASQELIMKTELKDGLFMLSPEKGEAEQGAELFNAHFDYYIGEKGHDKKRMISIWESPNFDLKNVN